jgi:hypothetical protein
MKFVDNRPLADTELAERKLLELANAAEADQAGRVQTGEINLAFLRAGGTPAEYRAAVEAAVAHGWLALHPSGAYLTFTQRGADLFA